MKHFGRILLLIASAGILQTALATADLQTTSACIAAAASSADDNTDCSPSGTGNSSYRPPERFAVPEGGSPQPEAAGGSVIDPPQPGLQRGSGYSGFSVARVPTQPVYLLTLRLRI